MYTITEGNPTFTGETREEAEAMRDRIKAHHARLELAYAAPASGTSVPMSNAERPDTKHNRQASLERGGRRIAGFSREPGRIYRVTETSRAADGALGMCQATDILFTTSARLRCLTPDRSARPHRQY